MPVISLGQESLASHSGAQEASSPSSILAGDWRTDSHVEKPGSLSQCCSHHHSAIPSGLKFSTQPRSPYCETLNIKLSLHLLQTATSSNIGNAPSNAICWDFIAFKASKLFMGHKHLLLIELFIPSLETCCNLESSWLFWTLTEVTRSWKATMMRH